MPFTYLGLTSPSWRRNPYEPTSIIEMKWGFPDVWAQETSTKWISFDNRNSWEIQRCNWDFWGNWMNTHVCTLVQLKSFTMNGALCYSAKPRFFAQCPRLAIICQYRTDLTRKLGLSPPPSLFLVNKTQGSATVTQIFPLKIWSKSGVDQHCL